MSCKNRRWKIAVYVVVFITALAWLVMALWNWLLPDLFAGVKTIDYVQALGVLLLSKILFGGLRSQRHEKWRQHHRENMSQAEREKIISRMKESYKSRKQNEAIEA